MKTPVITKPKPEIISAVFSVAVPFYRLNVMADGVRVSSLILPHCGVLKLQLRPDEGFTPPGGRTFIGGEVRCTFKKTLLFCGDVAGRAAHADLSKLVPPGMYAFSLRCYKKALPEDDARADIEVAALPVSTLTPAVRLRKLA